jgi:hypothetical protein
MFQGICAILRCRSRPSLGGDELAIERLQARAIRRVLATDFRATLQLLSRLRWGRCMDLGSHGLSLVSWLAPMPILPNRAGDRWERFERLHLGWCPTVLVYRENKLGEVQRRISVVGLHIYIDARTSKWPPPEPKVPFSERASRSRTLRRRPPSVGERWLAEVSRGRTARGCCRGRCGPSSSERGHAPARTATV